MNEEHPERDRGGGEGEGGGGKGLGEPQGSFKHQYKFAFHLIKCEPGLRLKFADNIIRSPCMCVACLFVSLSLSLGSSSWPGGPRDRSGRRCYRDLGLRTQ